MAAILNGMLLPAAVTHLRRITVLCLSVNSSDRYGSVTIARVKLHLRWPSDIGGTVGGPQQQLGSLFSKTQVAFVYPYRYRVKCF